MLVARDPVIGNVIPAGKTVIQMAGEKSDLKAVNGVTSCLWVQQEVA